MTQAACDIHRTPWYGQEVAMPVHFRAARRDKERRSSRRSGSCLAPSSGVPHSGGSALHNFAKLMARAQQKHSYKRAAHAQSFSNLVIVHFGVVTQREGHARAAGKLLQRLAHVLARFFGDEPLQLTGISVLQRHAFNVSRFQILANTAASQQIPALVSGHAVEPGVKWP